MWRLGVNARKKKQVEILKIRTLNDFCKLEASFKYINSNNS